MQREILGFLSPWSRYYLTYDPRADLRRIDIPVLALIGSKDLQVPAGPNRAAIAEALRAGGNTDATTRSLEGLNHLLQPADTGLVEEYARIEQTIAPEARELITRWIREHISS